MSKAGKPAGVRVFEGNEAEFRTAIAGDGSVPPLKRPADVAIAEPLATPEIVAEYRPDDREDAQGTSTSGSSYRPPDDGGGSERQSR